MITRYVASLGTAHDARWLTRNLDGPYYGDRAGVGTHIGGPLVLLHPGDLLYLKRLPEDRNGHCGEAADGSLYIHIYMSAYPVYRMEITE